MNHLKNIVDKISKLTILESLSLVKELEKNWGISANQNIFVEKKKDNKENEIKKKQI